MADLTGTLVNSEEMKGFYRMLARVQTNAIIRVMRGKTAEDIKELATIETKLLKKAADGGHKCPPPKVWDEAVGDCV